MTDAKEMVRLHQVAFPNRRVWTVAEMEQLISDPNTKVIQVENGFAVGQFAVDEMEIITIAVGPTARRLGKAKQMLLDLMQNAQKRGCQAVFLEVQSDNTAAIALYVTHGFQKVGVRKRYYTDLSGQKHDALVMRRDLSTASATQS